MQAPATARATIVIVSIVIVPMTLRSALIALLATALAGCAPQVIQSPEVPRVHVHQGRSLPVKAWVSLDLDKFDILGGGPLHTRGVLAPPEGPRLARQVIRGKIEETGLFASVEETEGPPPAGAAGLWLRVRVDIVVTTPSFGITSFAPTANVTGTLLEPGGARETLFTGATYDSRGTIADNAFIIGTLVQIAWREGGGAIGGKLANDLPRQLASTAAGARFLARGTGPPREVAPPAATASAPAPEAARPARRAGGPYAGSWALVIGINAYQNAMRLNYAVADAQAVAAALPALGFPAANTRVLLDGDATKARIETVLYREFAGIGPDDRLFVYFAGHGETHPIRGGEEGYLLPVDADPRSLPLTAIAMDDVKRIAQRLRARHTFFAMDACFSGFALARDAGAPKGTSDEYLDAALREPAVQVLTAGRKGERSIEEGGHGLFTRRLLDGLRGLADTEGRGRLTVAELAAWIEPRVVRDSNGRMTPQYGRLDGEGQFLFTLPRP
jgi:hypothetical protein